MVPAEDRKPVAPDRIESLRSMLWEILRELDDLQKQMETFQERTERSETFFADFIYDMSEVWNQ